MATTITTGAALRPDILKVVAKFSPGQFVIDKALPVFEVAQDENRLLLGAKTNILAGDTYRAYGAGALRIETSDAYITITTRRHTAEFPVDRELATKYAGTSIDPAQRAAEIAKTRVLMDLEIEGATLLTTSDNYNSNHVSAPSTKWNEANSTPIKDITDAMEQVRSATGTIPDTLILGPKVALALGQRTDSDLAKMASAPGLNAFQAGAAAWHIISAVITQKYGNMLGKPFQVYVGSANYAANTSSGTISDVWGNNAVLLCTGEYGVGALIARKVGYPKVESYHEEAITSTVYRYEDHFAVAGGIRDSSDKLIGAYLLYSVLSTS